MMTSEYCDSEVKRAIYHIKFESPDFAALEPSRIRCKEDMIRDWVSIYIKLYIPIMLKAQKTV